MKGRNRKIVKGQIFEKKQILGLIKLKLSFQPNVERIGQSDVETADNSGDESRRFQPETGQRICGGHS